MKLIRRTDAFTMMSELEDAGELNASAIEILSEIGDDEGKRNNLDFLVAHEYPEGVELWELTEFFNEETDLIRKEVGLSTEV